jgi:hypothetical protein
LDKTTKGFCEDAWSNFRKLGRDLGTAPTALPAVYRFDRHSPEIQEVALHRVPHEPRHESSVGILSIATATMWFVALAEQAGRSTPEPQHHQADDQRALI